MLVATIAGVSSLLLIFVTIIVAFALRRARKVVTDKNVSTERKTRGMEHIDGLHSSVRQMKWAAWQMRSARGSFASARAARRAADLNGGRGLTC